MQSMFSVALGFLCFRLVRGLVRVLHLLNPF